MTSRLNWIDWMRGLACLLMFQTHCYDSWLGGDARNTSFLHWSQRLGTLPAPLFLFLAGISFALVITKLLRKNQTPAQITRTMARRGAEIVAFGLLFRLQEYLIAWGWAPFSDLFRVDILNIIGLSMIFMALLCGLILKINSSKINSANINSAKIESSKIESSKIEPSKTNARDLTRPDPAHAPATFASGPISITPEPQLPVTALVGASIAITALIALLTPPLYTTWRPTWLPWQLESYIDGCHNLGAPQPWLFCIFPWTAFAFAGLAAGFILFSERGRERIVPILTSFAAIGGAAILIAYAFDHSSIYLYSTYDYWHTSPNFLMMRVGMLLMICMLAYAWTVWALPALSLSGSNSSTIPGTAAVPWAVRFSPLIQLGKTSLLVYWVHIEFVYGRFSLLPKRAVGIATATRGLIEIFLFMLILSIARTRFDWKKMKKIDWTRIGRKPMVATEQEARAE